MTRSFKLLPLAAVVMLSVGTASAAPSIAIDSWDGSILSGSAAFPALEAESILGEFASPTAFKPTGNQDDVPPEVIAGGGLDLVDALIGPIEGGLRFTWVLGSPLEVVPPEGIRYNWSFTVGGQAYQLQAKLTNMASITLVDAPQDHVLQAASAKPFFQLRGGCVAEYRGTPVAGCFHLAFLEGAFNMAEGTVTIDLPYGTAYALDVVPGATIVEAQSAGMSISASLQAAVSTSQVSAYINGWGRYATAPSVSANRVSDATSPDFLDYDNPMTLTGDSWSGPVDGSGGFIVARACNGATCTYDTLAV